MQTQLLCVCCCFFLSLTVFTLYSLLYITLCSYLYYNFSAFFHDPLVNFPVVGQQRNLWCRQERSAPHGFCPCFNHLHDVTSPSHRHQLYRVPRHVVGTLNPTLQVVPIHFCENCIKIFDFLDIRSAGSGAWRPCCLVCGAGGIDSGKWNLHLGGSNS